VKTALAADPALSALQIDVTTRDGVVTLEGPAPSEDARSRASVLAAAPAGVVKVGQPIDRQLAARLSHLSEGVAGAGQGELPLQPSVIHELHRLIQSISINL
jgi:BON domain